MADTEHSDSGRLEGPTARLAVSVLQSPSAAESHLISGETPWARAPDHRRSQGVGALLLGSLQVQERPWGI